MLWEGLAFSETEVASLEQLNIYIQTRKPFLMKYQEIQAFS